MQTLKERLDAFLRHKNLSQAKFAEDVGVSVGFANNVGNSISTKSLNKIQGAYPDLNSDWLLTGSGEMLKEAKSEEGALINNPNFKFIPLVSQYAQAGYLCGFADVGYVKSLPTIPTIVDHEIKGNYMAFEVCGDSMDNGTKESLEEGEILICREVTRDLWQYKLHLHKWNFVIVHRTVR